MNLSRVDDDPRDWDECKLMLEYFNDHPSESMKLMAYQSVRISIYDSGK